MNSSKLEIYGIDIPKGSVKDIDIALPRLYHLRASMPVYVKRGRREGPTLFVSAAIHGDELNGIEVIRRLKKLAISRNSEER